MKYKRFKQSVTEYAKAIADQKCIQQRLGVPEYPNSPYIREQEKVGGSVLERERSTEGEGERDIRLVASDPS